MIPYLLILLFVTITTHFGRQSKHVLIGRVSLVVANAVLVAFAGLRDYRVGTDTGNYVYQFSQIDKLALSLPKSTEPGYQFLSWLATLTSDSYASLLIVIAAVVVLLYVSTIVRLVTRYETGLYLFIALGSYTFLFNGARQAIAAAICFWAVRFVLARRPIAYAAAVAVAMLFHQTALVALPLYFLATPKLRLSRIVAIAAAVIVFIVFAEVFVGVAANLLDDRFAPYSVSGEGGGAVMAAFLAGQGVLLAWLVRVVEDARRDLYIRLLNIYLIALVPALVSVMSGTNPSGLFRLHVYFSAVAILMWPMVFHGIRGTRQNALVGLVFLVVTMAFFIMTTMSFSDLTPYRLHTEFS